nr:MAG TPA: hypothetical protein [Caudoviricetes sp.]
MKGRRCDNVCPSPFLYKPKNSKLNNSKCA